MLSLLSNTTGANICVKFVMLSKIRVQQYSVISAVCNLYSYFLNYVASKSSQISWLSHLLPPANEVWGKVIFWHLFVILFTGAGGHAWLGGVHSQGVHAQGGHAWLGACMPGGMWGMHGWGHVCMTGGHACHTCPPSAWYHEIRSVNEWAVHILLECILVLH